MSFDKTIAIHHRQRSFSEKWIEYCEKHSIPHKIVDCYDSNIVSLLDDCVGLMWHWSHSDNKARLMARQLTLALEQAGKKVFPDSKTSWHYDDKLGQKYLLESISAPLVPSYVFFNQQSAISWAKKTTYPKVFKTRNGAGSSNVRLIRNKDQAIKIIKRSFGKGIPSYNKHEKVYEKVWQFKRDKTLMSVLSLAKHTLKSMLPQKYQPLFPTEKNYAYFQDYVQTDKPEARITVVGEKAFSYVRHKRHNDFRASGSGLKSYHPDLIDKEALKAAMQVSKQLSLQVCAFDIIMKNNKAMIIEISYGFGGSKDYSGFWDENLEWNNQKTRPDVCMIENFITTL